MQTQLHWRRLAAVTNVLFLECRELEQCQGYQFCLFNQSHCVKEEEENVCIEPAGQHLLTPLK